MSHKHTGNNEKNKIIIIHWKFGMSQRKQFNVAFNSIKMAAIEHAHIWLRYNPDQIDGYLMYVLCVLHKKGGKLKIGL